MSRLFPTRAEIDAMTKEERQKFFSAMETVDEFIDERKQARSSTNCKEIDFINRQVNVFLRLLYYESQGR